MPLNGCRVGFYLIELGKPTRLSGLEGTGGDRRGQEGTHSEPVGLSGRLAQWRAEAEAATQSLSPWGSQRPQAGHHE